MVAELKLAEAPDIVKVAVLEVIVMPVALVKVHEAPDTPIALAPIVSVRVLVRVLAYVPQVQVWPLVLSVPWLWVTAPVTVKVLLIVRLPVKPAAKVRLVQPMATEVVTTAPAGDKLSKVTVSPAAIAATVAVPPDVVAKRLVTPSIPAEPPT